MRAITDYEFNKHTQNNGKNQINISQCNKKKKDNENNIACDHLSSLNININLILEPVLMCHKATRS